MKSSDLFTRAGSRRLSHSRLWANIACASATVLFLQQGFSGRLDADIWLVYLGVVGGYATALRLIAAWRDRGGA